MENLQPIEQNEQEKKGQEIWFIDDSSQERELDVLFTKRVIKKANRNDTCQTYSTGEEAINEIQRRIDSEEVIPSIIFIDYNLEGREVVNPKFKNGVDVIETLKEIAERHNIPLPKIVAFSNNPKSNQEMITAGAGTFLDKANIDALMEYLEKLYSNE